MSPLESLPGDQRAVLQLVLGKGRGYNEIARLLSLDPGAVRGRALAGAMALAPPTAAPPERTALICDYLLGQLDAAGIQQARALLAQSPGDRAWARLLAVSLGPLSSGPLPEIPVAPEPVALTPPTAVPEPLPAPPPTPVPEPPPSPAPPPPPVPE
ncbi:MAG: hypothetical protein ACRDL5_10410, partial [Solirubrobacteraceae bacterium]